MKLAVDMASILKTCLAVGKDEEGTEVEHDGRKVHINTAAYGYEFAVNSIKAALDEFRLTPINLIMVSEGMHSKSGRLMINNQYKAKRATQPPEYYAEYEKLQNMVGQVFKDLGAIDLSQTHVEGDDLLAFLAKHAEEDLVIMSNDGDMIALHGKSAHGADVLVRINGEVGHNKYGPFPHHLVTTYKALVGDTSDNIKGCPGFGPAAFLEFIRLYGEDGLQELRDMLESGSLAGLEELAESQNCKVLRKIFAERLSVLNSYYLARLYPEWCDTIDHALEWTPGRVVKVADERLKHWGAQTRLVGASSYVAALQFLKSKLNESPYVAFDIETSTPDESTDWLEQQGKGDGVDVIGSYLVGFSVTFGANNQYTYYVSVSHRDTDNITMRQAREMIESLFGKEIVIQNTNFELVVLAGAADEDGTKWKDAWEQYGQQGYIPGVLDTKLEASYVNENVKLGLKERSKLHLGYEQESYESTTSFEGAKGTLPAGGTLKREWTDDDGVVGQRRQYKMHELTAEQVFAYGADDTICTSALHNFYKVHMQVEHCWKVYLEVEIAAAYLHAHSFLTGVCISVPRNMELNAEDSVTLENATKVLNKYLTEQGWEGTVPPRYTEALTAAQIKTAYKIVQGVGEPDDDAEEEDALPVDKFLASRVRTPSKLLTLLQEEGHEVFASKLEAALAGDLAGFERYVLQYFTGEPLFKGSNKQMQVLLYEVMGLPIRIRNKPTAKMKAAGFRDGSPKGDALAVEYAKRDCTPDQKEILEAVRLIGMVKKRQSDFYIKYPKLVHWKTRRVHSSHNQSATNTRRASSSGPNLQQLPKHAKIEGQPAKFREVFIPHKRDAVIVSMDFAAQELRIIAERSQDANMLACYVGDSLRDMHSLTGLGILQRTYPDQGWTYESMQAALKSSDPELAKTAKEARTLGKKCNFTTEFGAAAPKLAQTLLVSEEEAQLYIDAKEEAFSGAVQWKQAVIKSAKASGKAHTLLGAPRHLRSALQSDDRYVASKAERQAVNFEVQSSAAEMTKLAEGRMWNEALFSDRFDAEYLGPIHDECVASVSIKDLNEFIPLMHACMVAPYANMQVPIESSISFGLNFGEQIEIGDKPVPQAIAKGLEDLK